jgi:hypothetical protein
VLQEVDSRFMMTSSDAFWKEYIKDDNILRAANFILTLDSRAVQKIHQPGAYQWLDGFRKQLEFYHKHTCREYCVLFNENTRVAMIEQSRTRLQRQTILVAIILTADIQQQLINYLNDPAAPVPTILSNERSG